MMKFECSGCGLCCRKVGKTIRQAREAKSKGAVNKLVDWLCRFPYKFDVNGICEKLADGKCTVYDNRPAVCQVEMSRRLFTKETQAQYYERTAKLCNEMIREAGLPETFLVKENYSHV